MPAIINTNIASLNAQRNLNSSQSALQTSLQRLSSGLRINSAKDDAAGLAISERFSTQIRGLNQAARNANDGISLAQTGEGALAAVTDNLQRIRELAVQAANSTNSADDRAALNLEVAQRLAEIDRTASQTSFNGQKLLDGSFTAAAFQIGANAGETISVEGLGNGVRLTATGQIAQATSTVLGNTATGGSLTTGAITPDDFSVVTGNGSVSFTATDNNFQALIAGKSSPMTVTSFDNDGTSAAIDGANVQGSAAAITDFDYSGAGLAQFNISDGITTANITLNANYANVGALATEIQTQMQAAGGNLATSTVTNNAGVLTFTNVGQTAALAISNVDANATTAGFVASAGTAGAAANAAAQFTVDGTVILMSTDSVNITGFATDINTKIQASALADKANYSAAVVNGGIVITHAGSTTAVAIGAPNAKAAASGITASAGVAGTADAGSATLDIDGVAVTLDQNYGSFDIMAAALTAQLGVNYSVANTAGAFTITRAGAAGSSTGAIAITNAAGGAAAAGLGNTAGTAGSATTTSATLSVDNQAITLTGNHATVTAVQGELQTKLNTAFGANAYTAAVSGGAISITNNTLGSAAVSLTATNAAAVTAGFGTLNVAATGTAGLTSGSVTLADLSINGTSLAGTYTDAAALATSINTNVTGVYATVSNGALTLSSAAAMTLAGTTDTAAMGLTAGAVAANSGNLASASVLTAASANSTIQRIDAALTSVSNLRSTFGAVQNRFESVISSLSATSENLTAARSRIQDTDFAAETAQLTRNQILQQAGTAMLAQANQLPNTVLSLLR